MNSNKTTTFAPWISRIFGEKKMKNYYFYENAGFLVYKMSTTLLVRKIIFTTVFVAQSTDPPIKNGVNDLLDGAP